MYIDAADIPTHLGYCHVYSRAESTMPSLISRTATTLLILHALLNIAQGVYCITRPSVWLGLAPDAFEGSPDAAVQAIGTDASLMDSPC